MHASPAASQVWQQRFSAPEQVTGCAQGTMTGNPSKASAELGWRRDISVRQLVHEMVDADMALAMNAQAQH
jgi:GDP-D-mannose dehydratase